MHRSVLFIVCVHCAVFLLKDAIALMTQFCVEMMRLFPSTVRLRGIYNKKNVFFRVFYMVVEDICDGGLAGAEEDQLHVHKTATPTMAPMMRIHVHNEEDVGEKRCSMVGFLIWGGGVAFCGGGGFRGCSSRSVV